MRPNILFIMADQMRHDCIGEEGEWVKTPNLDKIADKGILFTNCITNSPVCVPARVSLATGLYPHNTGIWQNFKHNLEKESNTWMQVLRDLGYKTSVFGKTHLHKHEGDLRDREDYMRAYGFDVINEIGGPRANAKVMSYMTEEWKALGLLEPYQRDYAERFATKPHGVKPSTLPLDYYGDVYVGQKTREYLEAYESDEPFFCMMSFGGPHEPWDTPEPYASQYNPQAMPKAIKPNECNNSMIKGHLDELISEYPESLTDADVQAMRANYAGNVSLIDEQIGEVLHVLENKGLLENTIILFTSDHGEMNGDHGMIYKSNFYDSAVRIPLIMSIPDMKDKGKRFDGLVELIDIGPTLVELAGGEMNYQQFGQSLCPVLSQGNDYHRQVAISEIFGELMVMTDEWKAMVNKEGKVYRLYKRLTDKDEVNNLAGMESMREVELELCHKGLARIMNSQLFANKA